MAINKKLIHFNEKSEFEKRLANGEILDTSIVFIKDSKEIWTHGNYYASTPILRSSGTSSVLQEVEVSSFVNENPDSPTSGQDIPTVASGNYSVVLNGKSNASAKRSLAHGNRTIAQGENSHTEGHCTQTIYADEVTNGYAAHAEGYGSMAGGTYSHAEGNRTKTAAPNSHAEGYLSITTPEAESSHAEGYETSAEAPASHTEGNNTKTHKAYSHAEGRQTETFGEASHTEGNETFTEGDYAHAEGWMTRAKGAYSHAEGQYTFTYADAAHSEGNNTHAHAPFSHAEGLGTKTNPDIIGQHVEGYYNADSDGVKVIGCGTGDDARVNAVEVKQDGRVFVKGLGNFDGTNSNEAADMAHVVNNKANSGDVYNKTEMDNRIKADLVQKVEVATINGQSLINGGNINIEDESVFVAEYGVTTYNEILTAFNSGKFIVCRKNNNKEYYIFNNHTFNSFEFYLLNRYGINYITIYNDDDWSTLFTTSFQTTDNMVDTISNSDPSYAYPSSIAVYNALTAKADKSELTELSKEVGKKQNDITDLETIRSGAAKGATALQSIPSEYITENELTAKSYATTAALNNKVDKIDGKQLSTNDFTTALKTKLEGLNNYDDTALENALASLQIQLNTLVSGNASDAINSFNEIIAFLNGIEDSDSLNSIIASIEQQIAGKVDKVSGKGLSTNDYTTDDKNKLAGIAAGAEVNVQSDWNATSGKAQILNKPTIPSAVTESTVIGWGFTKNTGTYSKPSTGIPKSDLADAVQTSLGRADTALQSYTEQYKGTVTGVKINGETKNPSSGVVDLGTVITEHQTLKTINGESIVGNDDIKISDVYITDFTVNDIEMLANGLSNNNIQADIAALYEAVSAHKLVLVPYDADEGYHGYGIVSGYMEDLFYITINLEQGKAIDLELDRSSNEIREDQIVSLRHWWDKQDTLISGTNIKTINRASILGEGNINVLTGVPIATVDVLGGIKPLKTTSGSIGMGTGSVISTNSAIALTMPTAANINSTDIPKNYPVIVDKVGVPFVNVPWTDDKVTATATTTTTFYVCGSSSTTTSTGALYKGAGVKVQSGTKLYASGGFFQSSDKTLKDIHGNIEVDLEKLSKLNKIYFNFKNNKDTTHVGVIAQEVQELYPEIVTTDSETGKLAVEYDKLSVIALAAVDRLYEKNNELEERISKLESIVNKLQNN